MTSQTFMYTILFMRATPQTQLRLLTEFVMESVQTHVVDKERFEQRLDAYAGMVGIDIVQAKINVCNSVRNMTEQKLNEFDINVK